MKKFTLLFSLIVGQVFAQTEGQVTYNRVTNWKLIFAHQKEISEEERDRIRLWKEPEGERKSLYILDFDAQKSHFKAQEQEGANDYGYSWKRPAFEINRGIETQEMNNLIEHNGKNYWVSGPWEGHTWKIQNQIKKVGDYICMRATAFDSLKKVNIEAWFTDALPVSTGPESYFGLPGLVLEVNLNEGELIIQLEKIELKKMDVKGVDPKTKAKKITLADYQAMIGKSLKLAADRKEIPWWSVRL